MANFLLPFAATVADWLGLGEEGELAGEGSGGEGGEGASTGPSSKGEARVAVGQDAESALQLLMEELDAAGDGEANASAGGWQWVDEGGMEFAPGRARFVGVDVNAEGPTLGGEPFRCELRLELRPEGVLEGVAQYGEYACPFLPGATWSARAVSFVVENDGRKYEYTGAFRDGSVLEGSIEAAGDAEPRLGDLFLPQDAPTPQDEFAEPVTMRFLYRRVPTEGVALAADPLADDFVEEDYPDNVLAPGTFVLAGSEVNGYGQINLCHGQLSLASDGGVSGTVEYVGFKGTCPVGRGSWTPDGSVKFETKFCGVRYVYRGRAVRSEQGADEDEAASRRDHRASHKYELSGRFCRGGFIDAAFEANYRFSESDVRGTFRCRLS